MRCMENLLSATLWNLATPRLDVATAELSTRQAQRFTAQQRHAFGLYFSQASRCALTAIVQIAFSRVAQHHMRQFMKERFRGHRSNRIDCDFSPPGEPLDVAVKFIEGSALNCQ